MAAGIAVTNAVETDGVGPVMAPSATARIRSWLTIPPDRPQE